MMGEGHAELLALIARTRNRWRVVTGLRVWMRAAAAAVVALGLALVTHLIMQPASGALVALWTAAVTVAAAVMFWAVASLRRAPGDGQLARFIEERCPELEDSLVTASQPYVGQWNRLVSTTNWQKGRIIGAWRVSLAVQGLAVNEYSDEAWARLVGGVTGQHVGRLRRVFVRFGESHEQYAGLFWSHFQAALDWTDAEGAPAFVREGMAGQRPALLGRIAEWKGWEAMKRFTEVVDSDFLLVAEERPPVPVSASVGGATTGEARWVVLHVPGELPEPGVPYRLVPRNEKPPYRWVVKDGLTAAR